MNTAKFQQHLVLHDIPACTLEAYLDEELVALRHVHHTAIVGVGADSEPIEGDRADHLRLNAGDMDQLARAWLRHRCGVNDEHGERGEGSSS